MSTLQIFNKKPKKVENVRARLQSLKNIVNIVICQKHEGDSLIQLQKSLQKHNTIETDTKPEIFRRQDEEDIIIEDKLWNYFKYKAQDFSKKIQKQKVNGWSRVIKKILFETEKKIKLNELHITQMQQIIKNKYKQSHELFKQIQKIKVQRQDQREKGSRRKRGNVETSRGQKITIIKQNIASLKSQIEERTTQNDRIKFQLAKLQEQKRNLLINLIKNGYYLNDGIKLFLERLAEIGYKPNLDDFPQFLDIRSKQYLIKQFQDYWKRMQGQKALTQRNSIYSQRIKAKSNAQLGAIAKKQHFKDIYNETRNYLSKLLLLEQWKNSPVKLPKIQVNNHNQLIEKRRQIQKKRIKIAYPLQERQKVKKILFGIKLQTILP